MGYLNKQSKIEAKLQMYASLVWFSFFYSFSQIFTIIYSFPGAFGPFGSNKKNERHPTVEEEKPVMEAQPVTEPPVTVDPNAPKVEAKRTVPTEFADNSTQPVLQQEPTTEKSTA